MEPAFGYRGGATGGASGLPVQSVHGPTLIAITEPTAEPLEATLADQEGLHRLIWPSRSALQIRTERSIYTVHPPFGLWVPSDHAVSVQGSAPAWIASWSPETCPATWDRVARLPVADVVGPLLIHLSEFAGRAQSEALVSAIVDELHQALQVAATPLPFPIDARARSVADALASDPSIPWELDDWAQDVGASARTLRRLFREETGLTFRQWRLRLRTQAAIPLLLDGVAIERVATHCGYRSSDAFTRAFQAETGHKPSEIRAAHLGPESQTAVGEPHQAHGPTPRFLAAFSWAELDTLLALDVDVVARGTYGEPRTRSQIDAGALEIEAIAQSIPPDLDQLSSFQPDSIFVSFEDASYPEILRALEVVAPTVVVPAGDPELQLQTVGLAVGAEPGRVNDAVARVRATYDSFAPARTPESISFVEYHGDDVVYVYGPKSSPSRVLQRLGLHPLHGGQAGTGVNDPTVDCLAISLEELDTLAPDVLLVSTFAGNETEPGEPIADLTAHPAYKSLDAVQNGNAFVLTPELSRALDTASALNAEVLVRGLEQVLREINPTS